MSQDLMINMATQLKLAFINKTPVKFPPISIAEFHQLLQLMKTI
jgi:hypothetical protein